MVVAVFAWINALGLVVHNEVLYGAAASIGGLTVVASGIVAIILVATLASGRRILSARVGLSVAWYVVALGWYPAGLLLRALIGDGPAVLLAIVFGVPVLFVAEMVSRRRRGQPATAPPS